MGKANRTCIICGTKYEYCGKCSDKILARETWRNIYCSEKCRETFSILERYTIKGIDADTAIKELRGLGVKMDDISSKFKPTLDSIAANKTVADRKKKNHKKKNIVNDD